MSRTYRNRINPDHDRDNKGRCKCCGKEAKQANHKRDRATIKRQLRNNPSQ